MQSKSLVRNLLALCLLVCLASCVLGARVSIWPSPSSEQCPADTDGVQVVSLENDKCTENAFSNTGYTYQKVECGLGDSYTYTESNNADCSGGRSVVNSDGKCYGLSTGADGQARSIEVFCSSGAALAVSWLALLGLLFGQQLFG